MSPESLVGIGLGLDGPRRIAPIRTDTSMFAPGRNTLYTARRRSSMNSEGREQKSKVYVNMDVVRDLYQKYSFGSPPMRLVDGRFRGFFFS
jgi:hypothetical protein